MLSFPKPVGGIEFGTVSGSQSLGIGSDYEAAKVQNTADRAALKAKHGLGGV